MRVPGPQAAHRMTGAFLFGIALLTITHCGSSSTTGGEPIDVPDTSTLSDTLTDADGLTVPDLGRPDLGGAGDLDGDGAPDLDTDTDTDGELVCEPGAGAFGCSCEENGDCMSGYCGFHLGEKICAEGCVDKCDPGWNCTPVSVGGADDIYVCISKFPHLCLPCADNDDCRLLTGSADVCVSYGEVDGSFCGGACEESGDCPASYVCADVETFDGKPVRECIPSSGECTCSETATKSAFSTPCSITNDWGTCAGERSCSSDGLTACSAAIPAEEICFNEVDDDCDGEADLDDKDCIAPCLCGDGVCEPDRCGEQWDEEQKTCAADCAVCGNLTCDPGEGAATCDTDCCGGCGDGICRGGECGESPLSCPEDCGAWACGDGTCNPGENPVECPDDCQRFTCGNGTCEPTEDSASCSDDCNQACGDCICDLSESAATCPRDCGYCGDAYCLSVCSYLAEETPDSCPEDCMACVASCGELVCGFDWCGESCGTCPAGSTCSYGACVCVPSDPPDEQCDGIDNDCDGLTDADDLDLQADDAAGGGVGPPCALQEGVCAGASKPADRCQDGVWAFCIDDDFVTHDPSYQTGSETTCDGADNDCDGEVDEDDMSCPPGRSCQRGACLLRCDPDPCLGGICDVETGACDCLDNWSGPACSSCESGTSLSTRRLAQLGGRTRALDVTADHVCWSSGEALWIGHRPGLGGGIVARALPGGEIFDMVTRSGRLWLALGEAGVVSIDMADPSAPGEPVPVPVSNMDAVDRIAAGGDLIAVLATSSDGLRKIHILGGMPPGSWLGSRPVSDACVDLSLVDELIVLACGVDGLVILDASQPLSTQEAVEIATPGSANAVLIEPDQVFVADGDAGLTTVTRLDGGLFEVAETSEVAFPLRVVGRAGERLIAAGEEGVAWFDASAPGAPVHVGTIWLEQPVHGLVYDGEHVLLANGAAGLGFLSTSSFDDGDPQLCHAPFPVQRVARVRTWSGGLVGLSEGGEAFLVVTDEGDLSVGPPVFVPLTEGATSLAVTDGRLLIGRDDGTLLVMDLNGLDPASPVTESFSLGGAPDDLAVHGQYLYVAAGAGGLFVHQATPPYTLLGSTSTPGSAHAVEVSNGHAYVADSSNGLQIIDVHLPTAPALMGQSDTGTLALEVSVHGAWAYVVDMMEGIVACQIETPGSPVCSAFLDVALQAVQLRLVGDLLLVAAGGDGLGFLDVASQEGPSWLDVFQADGFTSDVALRGGRIYLANSVTGLWEIGTTCLPEGEDGQP